MKTKNLRNKASASIYQEEERVYLLSTENILNNPESPQYIICHVQLLTKIKGPSEKMGFIHKKSQEKNKNSPTLAMRTR